VPDRAAILAALAGDGLHVDSPGRLPAVSGGSRLETRAGPVFLKIAPQAESERLEGEADGLAALARAGALRVPTVLACGTAGGSAFLALEWLAFEPATPDAGRALGRGLAALHRVAGERFGWHRDNTIGATPQVNTPDDDWIAFFREHRLRFQLELAAHNGYGGALQAEGRALLERLERLFDGYSPRPSLLHGDLWGGNWSVVGGAPVIFDPAVHYGDRECDLAMTRLFGGFGREFYAAYDEAWPLEPGHERRLALYQLYHVLNHLNLFGSGYLARARGLIRALG
jgi:fructosamine-3-kinase